jgi:hypothetical protein
MTIAAIIATVIIAGWLVSTTVCACLLAYGTFKRRST